MQIRTPVEDSNTNGKIARRNEWTAGYLSVPPKRATVLKINAANIHC